MLSRAPMVTVTVDAIHIKPGEAIVIMFQPGEPGKLLETMEIRMLADGTQQVFWQPDTKTQFNTFDEWTRPEPEEKP